MLMKLILLKKRFLSTLILLLALSMTLVSCASADDPKITDSSAPKETTAFIPEDHVFPPGERINPDAIVDYYKAYDVQTAFEEATLVARVRITDWVCETEHSSFYSAEVLTVYKGNPKYINGSETNIHLSQYGSSRGTAFGTVLFIPGNEFILFMLRTKNDLFGNHYSTLNENHTILDVLRSDDGKEWIAPRVPYIDNDIEHLKADCTEEFRQELLENLKEADPIWNRLPDHIYALNVIEEYFDSL